MSKNFLRGYNNGVTALISEEDAQRFGLIVRGGGDPVKAGVRIFTFCRDEKVAGQPGIFTGSNSSMEILLKVGGHTIIERRDSGWDGYVPFSNGVELHKVNGKPDVAAQHELRWCTTTDDVVKAFLS